MLNNFLLLSKQNHVLNECKFSQKHSRYCWFQGQFYLPLSSAEPVSYTHLDVYKRQPYQ